MYGVENCFRNEIFVCVCVCYCFYLSSLKILIGYKLYVMYDYCARTLRFDWLHGLFIWVHGFLNREREREK